MANKVKAIPDGYHAITPYLSIKGAAAALEFYKRALGAELVYKLDMPDGKIGHAEIQIGDSRIMLADENDMADGITKGPTTLGGTTFGIVLYGENVDARFKRAVDAGAKVVRPVTDQFYGDRSGTVQDPFGHLWTVSTHIEDVTPDQLRERMSKMKP
jgi:PhnB protein